MTVDDRHLKAWFCGEVIPLEPALTRYIRRNWRAASERNDLRQEVYARVLSSVQAQGQLPQNTAAFVFAIARNHLIDCARRARIVRIDLVAELEGAPAITEVITPERIASAREELRRVQVGLERLPKRCREVIRLRRIDGLSQRETADRLGISVKAVEQQTTKGMRVLVDVVLGEKGAREPAASGRTAGKRRGVR